MHDVLIQACYASMLGCSGLTILDRRGWHCMHQAQQELESMIILYHYICYAQLVLNTDNVSEWVIRKGLQAELESLITGLE